MSPLEGTYLAWIDFRETGVDPAELKETMLKKTRLWLNAGEIFGTGGAGFQRLNLAAPRSTVLDACARIEKAFS
jgi:cystathionine beta-lyase